MSGRRPRVSMPLRPPSCDVRLPTRECCLDTYGGNATSIGFTRRSCTTFEQLGLVAGLAS